MATKIGFKLQDKPVIADTSSLIDLSNTLLNQEKDRETQRQAWRDEQDTLRKTQDELTPTANQNKDVKHYIISETGEAAEEVDHSEWLAG